MEGDNVTVTLSDNTSASPHFIAPELPDDINSINLVFKLVVEEAEKKGGYKYSSDPDNVTITVNRPDINCYATDSVGKVGNVAPCANMLIVDRSMLVAAIADADNVTRYTFTGRAEGYSTDDSSPAHVSDNKTYSFGNSDGDGTRNIFTGQVDNMSGLFSDTDFNADIGYWEVDNVTDMSYMFDNATTFNQNLSGWNVSNIVIAGGA